jgi:hypothetical protein
VSGYRVLRDFAFEGRVYGTGHILRQSNPIEARIIREWPWPSFFSAEPPRTETRTPTRRRPSAVRSPRRSEPARPCLSAWGGRSLGSVVCSLRGREA